MERLVRRVEVLRDGNWIECKFEEMKCGETIRLYDPPEMNLVSHDGCSEFKTTTDPFINEDGIWEVMTIDPSWEEE